MEGRGGKKWRDLGDQAVECGCSTRWSGVSIPTMLNKDFSMLPVERRSRYLVKLDPVLCAVLVVVGIQMAVGFGAVRSVVIARGVKTAQVPEQVADELLDWWCDWRLSTAADSNSIFGTTSRGSGLDQCFGSQTAFTADLFSILDVIENPGTKGFPAGMTNILKVNGERGSVSGLSGSPMLQADSAWRAPAAGEYLFFRGYVRLEQPECTATCLNIHPLHFGTNKWVGNDYSGRFFSSGGIPSDSSFYLSQDPNFQTANSGVGQGRFLYPKDGLDPSNPNIKTYQTYRYEVRMEFLVNDSITWNTRVYNSAGTLLLTEVDYGCHASEVGGCNDGFSQYELDLGERKHTLVGSNGRSAVMGLEVGNNGVTENDGPAGSFWYWGGLAVRISSLADDWIGEYPVGPEAN